MQGSEIGSVQLIITDPDPGGPKTHNSLVTRVTANQNYPTQLCSIMLRWWCTVFYHYTSYNKKTDHRGLIPKYTASCHWLGHVYIPIRTFCKVCPTRFSRHLLLYALKCYYEAVRHVTSHIIIYTFTDHRVLPPPPSAAKAGRNHLKWVNYLPPPRSIGERYSQTISNLCQASLMWTPPINGSAVLTQWSLYVNH